MNKLIILLASVTMVSCAKPTWISLAKEEGLEVSAAWKEVKRKPGESGGDVRLEMKVENTGKSAVTYQLGLDFFLNGVHIENIPSSEYCAMPGRTYTGKLNGVYFEPEKFSFAQVKDSSVSMEILPLEILEVQKCVGQQ